MLSNVLIYSCRAFTKAPLFVTNISFHKSGSEAAILVVSLNPVDANSRLFGFAATVSAVAAT